MESIFLELRDMVKDGHAWNLFYMWDKIHLLVKDDTQAPDSGAGGQSNAIQI